MAKKNVRTTSSRPKINKKNIVKMLIPITVAVLILYVLFKIIQLIIVPTDIIVIQNGTIFNEESAVGYVIRDEKVANNNSNKAMIQIKAEGEKVAKGSQIFRYTIENEDQINAKIDELDSKIQEALLGQTELFSSDIKAIENQIETKIDGLKSKNDIQEISEYKKDINTYIIKKSKITGDLSPAGSYINGLIEEKENYQKNLIENSEYAIAPTAGIVSYRVDNLEEVLTPNNFESLNKNMLEDLNLQTGQIITTSSEKGKVINNYECYIATILDSEEAKEAVLGNRVTLRLSTQDEVDASISYISTQNDKSVLIVFEINNCVEKLIDYRKITFDVIWWRHEGLKVPKSAIYYDNGLSYVVRNRAGYQDKILIQVLKENDNFCIVGNYNNEDLRSLEFTTREIDNMKKISIYDEIVANPKIQ